MSLSGFSSFLTDPVKDKRYLSHYYKIGYKVMSLSLVALLVACSAGCNLTVHRPDGLGKASLGPVSAQSPAREALPENSQEVEAIEGVVAENTEDSEPQPAQSATEAENEGVVQDSGDSEASGETVSGTEDPAEGIAAEKEPSEQSPPAGSGENLPVISGKIVPVSGKVVEAQGAGPRAFLASLSKPGGAKVSPAPLEGGGGGTPGLPVEEKGLESPEESADPEPDPASGSTELTSAVDSAEAPPQEDKKENAEEAKSEEKPPGTGGGDSSGDDKSAEGGDSPAAEEAGDEGEEKSKFPYGIIIVLVACLGIAIFQNSAGKSI